jgi:hypothetical protein
MSTLTNAGVGSDEALGFVVRNQLPHAAAVLALIAGGRPIAMIYSYQSPESIGRDIEQLGLAAVVADADDWDPHVRAAADRAGSAAVALSLGAADQPGCHAFAAARARLPIGADVAAVPPRRRGDRRATVAAVDVDVGLGTRNASGARRLDGAG